MLWPARIAAATKRLVLGDVVVRRNPVFYPEARAWLAGLESADVQGRRAVLRQQLERSLLHAAQTPYGRRVGGGASLEAWPLLEKSTLRDEPRSFLRGRSWFAGEASTSGTTGLQVPLRRCWRSMSLEQAYIDQVLEQMGVNARRARIAILRGDNVKSAADRNPPFWVRAANGRRLHFSCSHLGPDTLEHYLSTLRAFRPHVLWVYPSNLEWLCQLLQRAGRHLQIPCVLSSSEVLSPATWQLARECLGARVADYYGQAERVAFAVALHPGSFRFLPGYAWLELLPIETTGETTRYEIVGTTLWNTAMPLVRYRTGDFIELPAAWGAAELEAVTLGLRDFGGVLGRTVEYLVAPDGTILNGVGNLTKGAPHVVRVQTVQPDLHSVHIHLLVSRGFTAEELEQVRANAREAIPASMTVTVEISERLQRTPVGKTPLVVHGAPVRQFLASRSTT